MSRDLSLSRTDWSAAGALLANSLYAAESFQRYSGPIALGARLASWENGRLQYQKTPAQPDANVAPGDCLGRAEAAVLP